MAHSVWASLGWSATTRSGGSPSVTSVPVVSVSVTGYEHSSCARPAALDATTASAVAAGCAVPGAGVWTLPAAATGASASELTSSPTSSTERTSVITPTHNRPQQVFV